ncbi:collagenase [Bacillus thuringiensis]|uniref:microbial collagenase n=1 Tax=Bacillus thuringiensis TaxID=1428 RepID=A0A9W3SHM4_BACTU|nr:collagenase [Bacillus thuringiensis]ANS51755.1 microbial collagenase ColA [Bacillus thuringiensis]MBH0338444.1 collagenase [Bacillus thuringiensis]
MKRIGKIIIMLLCCTILSSVHVVQENPMQFSSKLSIPKAVRSVAQGMLGSALVPPSNPIPYDFNLHSSEIKRQYMSQDSFHKPYPYTSTLFSTTSQIDQSIQPPDEKLNFATLTATSATQQTYTMAQLQTLSYENLVQVLSTIRWGDITDLFQFNPDSLAFYQDKNRIQFLMQTLEKRGATYTATNSNGIETLVEVLRSGFYLGYYYKEIAYLNERAFHDTCFPALKAIASNPAFQLGTIEQDRVVAAYGNLIGNASSNPEIVSLAVPILNQFNQNLKVYAKEYSKGSAVYSLLSGIDHDLQTYLYQTGTSPNQSPWYGKINAFIDEIGKMALYGQVNADTGWIINNGIYYTSRMGVFHTTAQKGLQMITNALQVYPYLSEAYLIAAQQIDERYNGKDVTGNPIDYKKIQEEGKKYYTPKTYTFDNGAMIIKTGQQVTEEKIQRLYWASKEVEAQFYRVIGSDTPLEKGHRDDILTMVIYNSPTEYQLNRLLYGYDTKNGGIYIEQDGTFFTYERTPKDSIYSLEELFRHEFTHYLQGRYLVPGLFGAGELYENERLTWFEEGNAEFFAGSTRTDQVVPRKTIVQNLAADPVKRYTLQQTLYAIYGNWEFYNYSFALQSYLYQQRWDLFSQLHDIIKNNQVIKYDQYRETLSKNTALNTAYQNYMQMLIDHQKEYSIPAVSDEYLKRPEPKPLTDVQKEITKIIPLQNTSIIEQQSDFFHTFTLRGTYTGKKTAGVEPDWKNLNTVVDALLKQLSTKPWNGYKTVTAYFTNYRINTNNQIECDIVFQGIANNMVVSKEPNDSIQNANLLPFNTSFTGDFHLKNALDIYQLDVQSPTKLSIETTNQNQIQMNWILYHEKDLENPVAYAAVQGRQLTGTYTAQPGKYYLYVYSYDKRSGGYQGIVTVEK